MRNANVRERILIAARRSFASKGFRGAATREIAKEAGVAEVTLFRQFGSKEGLLLEVLTPAFRQSIRRIGVEGAGKSARDVLTNLCKARLECSEENTDLMSIVWTEIHVNPLVREVFRKAIAESAQELAPLLGDVPPETCWILLGAVFGVVAFYNLYGLGKAGAGASQVAGHLSRILADGALD